MVLWALFLLPQISQNQSTAPTVPTPLLETAEEDPFVAIQSKVVIRYPEEGVAEPEPQEPPRILVVRSRSQESTKTSPQNSPGIFRETPLGTVYWPFSNDEQKPFPTIRSRVRIRVTETP